MRPGYRDQRLFVESRLSTGATVAVSREQANYLVNVLRLKHGAQILLFNGQDGEWLARIELTGRKACTLHVAEQTRPQPPAPSLQYLFAPLKQARLDYMIQKAVEMGAGVLQPVLTQYTMVRTINENRMRANAIEAAEQCGILCLPEIRTPVKLETLLDDWDPAQAMIFCDESAKNQNPLHVLAKISSDCPGVLIGPEGGFSPHECELLKACAFVTPISLGPRILRADTAAIAALSMLQLAVGVWEN